MKKNYCYRISFLLFSNLLFSQTGINNTNPSATLDVVSTTNTSITKALRVSNASSVEMFTILNTGNVGVNSPSPASTLEVRGTTTTILQDSWDNYNAYEYSDTKFSVMNLKRARGNTIAVASYIKNGDQIGALAFKNHVNSGGAEIHGFASEDHTSSAAGSELRFLTIANGSNTPDIRVKVTNDGKVGILPANSSFGGGTANNPNSTLQVFGSLSTKIRAMSSGTVADDDYTILVQGAISLPSPNTNNQGRMYILVNDTTSTLTINGFFRINGSNFNNYDLNGNNGGRGVMIQSSGSAWVIINRF